MPGSSADLVHQTMSDKKSRRQRSSKIMRRTSWPWKMPGSASRVSLARAQAGKPREDLPDGPLLLRTQSTKPGDVPDCLPDGESPQELGADRLTKARHT